MYESNKSWDFRSVNTFQNLTEGELVQQATSQKKVIDNFNKLRANHTSRSAQNCEASTVAQKQPCKTLKNHCARAMLQLFDFFYGMLMRWKTRHVGEPRKM